MGFVTSWRRETRFFCAPENVFLRLRRGLPGVAVGRGVFGPGPVWGRPGLPEEALAGPVGGAAAAPSGAASRPKLREPPPPWVPGGGEGGTREGHAQRVERRLSEANVLLWFPPAKNLAGGPCCLLKEPGGHNTAGPGARPGPTCQ
eukprot:gene23424-biopygen10336